MIDPEIIAAAFTHQKTGILYNKDMFRFEFFIGGRLVAWHTDSIFYRGHKREIDLLVWQRVIEGR